MATTGPKLTTPFVVGTDKLVGQGDKPELVARISYSDASVDPSVWTDVTEKVRSWGTSCGRESELSEADAGTATVTLDNRDRDFDPAVASIRPMARVWLQEQFSGETQDLFHGYVEAVDQVWPGWGGSDAEAIVSCADEMKALNLDKLPTTSPPRDSYGDVVMYDEPHGYWRFDDGDIKAGARPTVGAHLATTPGGAPTQATPSPIVGDPGKYVNLPAGDFLSTVVQELGECGDVCGLTEFAAEMWLKLQALPTSDVNLLVSPVASTTTPYRFELRSPGFVRVVAQSTTTEFTVDSATLTAQTWYHIVATITAGFLRLYVNGAQVASTAWTGAFHSGLTDSPLELGGFDFSKDVDELAVYRHGLTADRVYAHYEAGRLRGFPSQLPGARVNAVLDAAGSHAPRYVQTGTAPMTATFMRGQSPLEELRQAVKADSVDALLFMAKDGTLTFLAHGHRAVSPWNTVQATFGDAGGSELPYEDVDIDYSEAFLFNDIQVTRSNGLTQSASDATSIARYGKRTLSLTDLPVTLDLIADNIAVALLAKYKDPMQRILSLTLDTSIPDVTEAVFRLDIGDRIRVLRTPPGGGARIDQTSFVQKIEIAGANDGKSWRIRLGVSPL